MADNVNVKNAAGSTVAAAADELGDSSFSPKVSLLRGDGTAVPISPATALAEDAAHSSGDLGVLALAVRRDTPVVGSGTDGDNSTLNVDGTGRLYVNAQNLADFTAGEYETVAASQTAQVVGPTGAAGDFIAGLLIIPATTSPGQVLLLDNATSITIFVGGAASVSNLIPFFVPLGIKSVSGAWKVTTGADVSVIASGNFT